MPNITSILLVIPLITLFLQTSLFKKSLPSSPTNNIIESVPEGSSEAEQISIIPMATPEATPSAIPQTTPSATPKSRIGAECADFVCNSIENDEERKTCIDKKIACYQQAVDQTKNNPL